MPRTDWEISRWPKGRADYPAASNKQMTFQNKQISPYLETGRSIEIKLVMDAICSFWNHDSSLPLPYHQKLSILKKAINHSGCIFTGAVLI